MAFEWVSGLFQGGNQQTRGLSRDHSDSVALDNANPFYNYRLKRHVAEGDVIGDPTLLWFTSPYVKRRTGMGSHIGTEVGDGTAGYTDVLVILSRDDWARASAEWQANATSVIQREFDQFCRRENFTRIYPHRPLGVRLVEDGGPATGGQSLSLARGEFVTGLVPNLYTGPVRGSYPVIGVHLNLPGVWEGYREVGRVYNDQILFTIGNHWLDNFHHPSLQQAALYRLRQYSDGSFMHVVNPDLQDQYQVTSSNQGGGASVLTLATRAGTPLAYMVLAVIDPPKAQSTGAPAPQRSSAPVPSVAPPAPGRPAIHVPSPQSTPFPSTPRPTASGPAIAPPMMMEEQASSGRPAGSLGGKTIIPDAPSEKVFTLQERGALLQKVHFAAFMLGYDVYLGQRGELGTNVAEPAATFQVRKRSVQLLAHIDNVRVAGRPVLAGVEVPIEGDVTIDVNGQKFEYRDLRSWQLEGWPYVGEIRRPASSSYMVWGEEYQVGRSRESRVMLPDEPRNENIHWKPGVGDGSTIRARSGEIPKARFYTDSIMVASEHAAINLTGERPRVVCSARHCYVYVRRGQNIYTLHPAASEHGPKDMELDTGDEVLIGNCLFHVSYNPGDLTVPAPAPMVKLDPRQTGPGAPARNLRAPTNADRLVADVPAPNLQALDRDTGPSAPSRAFGGQPGGLPPLGSSWGMSPSDVPSREVAPPPAARGPVMDSILGSPGMRRAVEVGPVAVGQPRGSVAPSIPPRGAVQDGRDVGGWDSPEWDDSAPTIADGHANGQDPFLSPYAADPRASEPGSGPRVSGPRMVAAVDEAEAQMELGRPMHLVLAGWVVQGEAVCGNYATADMVIPESRTSRTQAFAPRDYFRVKLRGRKAAIEVLDTAEVEVDGAAAQPSYEDADPYRFDVIRRDEAGERDFVVSLRLADDPRLPSPRARLLSIVGDDRWSAPLLTRGLPRGASRTLALGDLRATFFVEGGIVRVSDYLRTYRRGEGFMPFLVQRGDDRFRTAPEDGAPFEIGPGDRLIVGSAVYTLRNA